MFLFRHDFSGSPVSACPDHGPWAEPGYIRARPRHGENDEPGGLPDRANATIRSPARDRFVTFAIRYRSGGIQARIPRHYQGTVKE